MLIKGYQLIFSDIFLAVVYQTLIKSIIWTHYMKIGGRHQGR